MLRSHQQVTTSYTDPVEATSQPHGPFFTMFQYYPLIYATYSKLLHTFRPKFSMALPSTSTCHMLSPPQPVLFDRPDNTGVKNTLYKLWSSSLRSFVHPLASVDLLDSKYSTRPLFSNILILSTSLNHIHKKSS
jgi:hypothetical protein